MKRRSLTQAPLSPAIHPLAKLFREMTEEEYLALRDDLQWNGQLEPIVFFQDQILDGRHRYRACQDLGLDPLCEELLGDIKEAKAFVISQNAYRRHLSVRERREVIAMALATDPSQSDRTIARSIGVSPHTVKTQRQAMESTAQIAQLKFRKGRDGRSRSLPASNRVERVEDLSTPVDTEDKIQQVKTLLLDLCRVLQGMAPDEGMRCLIQLEAEFRAFGALYLPFKSQRSSHRTYGGPRVELLETEAS